jgi:hypothetical protein
VSRGRPRARTTAPRGNARAGIGVSTSPSMGQRARRPAPRATHAPDSGVVSVSAASALAVRVMVDRADPHLAVARSPSKAYGATMPSPRRRRTRVAAYAANRPLFAASLDHQAGFRVLVMKFLSVITNVIIKLAPSLEWKTLVNFGPPLMVRTPSFKTIVSAAIVMAMPRPVPTPWPEGLMHIIPPTRSSVLITVTAIIITAAVWLMPIPRPSAPVLAGVLKAIIRIIITAASAWLVRLAAPRRPCLELPSLPLSRMAAIIISIIRAAPRPACLRSHIMPKPL